MRKDRKEMKSNEDVEKNRKNTCLNKMTDITILTIHPAVTFVRVKEVDIKA